LENTTEEGGEHTNQNMDNKISNLDGVCLASSLGLFSLYYLYAYSSFFCSSKENIQLKRNLHNAMIWLSKHTIKDDPQSVTLAIQTLRNTMLAAIFVGGACFQYGFTLINTVTIAREAPTAAEIVRTVIVSTFLFLSFFAWASVIRAAAHLGYIIGVLGYSARDYETGILAESAEKQIKVVDMTDELVQNAQDMLQIMLTSFNLGFRFLFLSIPFIFYAIGPFALLVSSAFVVVCLYIFDFSSTVFHPKLRTSKEASEHANKKEWNPLAPYSKPSDFSCNYSKL